MTADSRTTTIPPHDLAAERHVLGCVLVEADAHDVASDTITGEDFYLSAHARIWTAMGALRGKGSEIGIVTLRAELGADLAAVGGDEALLALTNESVASVVRIGTYAAIVAARSRQRALLAVAWEIAARARVHVDDIQELLDWSESRLLAATRRAVTPPRTARLGDLLPEAIRVAEAANKCAGVTGWTTGLHALDMRLSGLHAGDLYVVAGRPGMGKKAFALCVALRAAASCGAWVAFFSLEMPREQMAVRALCVEGRVDQQAVRAGRMSSDDWGRFSNAAEALHQLRCVIDDTAALSVPQLRARLRRIRAAYGPIAVVVVDYLQLMRPGERMQSREQEVAMCSQSLKAIAKEFEVAVIALSQLNRGVESRADKRPMLSDLRESGAIEQDADAVMFLYRDEVYNPQSEDGGICEIAIAKQRNGPTSTLRARFDAASTRFDDLGYGQEDA